MSQHIETESPEKTQQQHVERRESRPDAAQSFHGGLHPIAQLQQMLGNRRVAQLIQAKRLTLAGKILGLQRQRTVGAADDPYEQEADRVARQVMYRPDAVATASAARAPALGGVPNQTLQTQPLDASITPIVQWHMGKKNEGEEDSEEEQDASRQATSCSASAALPLQRPMATEEETAEPIQAQSADARRATFAASADVETQLSLSTGRGNPLPDPVCADMEPRFGVDFSPVHVHTGSDARQMHHAVGAQAFTHGSDMYFGAGHHPTNLALTAHEITHVVQQTGGGPLQTQKREEAEAPPGPEPAIQRICAACAADDREEGSEPISPQNTSTAHRAAPASGEREARPQEPPRATGLPEVAMRLQSAAGNARTIAARGLLRQSDPAPPPAPSPPQEVSLAKQVVDFTTPTATLGGVGVRATGRMLVSGKATVTDPKLPAKASAAMLRTRASELVGAALAGAAPTGAGTRVEVSLGGKSLVLELAAAPTGPAFQVTARFEAKANTLSAPGVEVASPQIVLDATVWIAPPALPPAPAVTGAPAPAGTSPAQSTPPGAAPPGGAPAPPQAVAATPGDSAVKSYSFAGDTARFSDTAKGGRSGSLSLKSSFDDFDKKLKPEVKAGALGFLTRPEQVLAFFQEMRSYFGTDDKTIAHFATFRKANIKGATTILHEAAAARLEAVQAEIGVAEMPASGGIGWPRSECRLSGQAGLHNLHNLGMAIDFNAYQAPHIKDARIRDLISVTTGRGPTANYPSTKGVDTRKTGETSTTGSDADKEALGKDAAVTKWLDGVEAEATALGKASEDFRGSLQTTADPKDPKSAAVDNGPKLVALRKRWHTAASKPEAERNAERAAVMAELPAVVKPWLDKIVAQRSTSQADLTRSGIDAATLPAGLDAIAKAALTAERLRESAKPLLAAAVPLASTATTPTGTPPAPAAPAPALPKARRGQIDALITQARAAVGEKGGTPAADDAAAVAELKRLNELLEKRGIALLASSRITRMTALEAALSDAAFMFGSAQKAVVDPSAAQLVGEGFFTLKGAPGAGAEAFSAAFVRSMLKHGFGHGAEWGTPDLMHFELRWKGPGQ